MLTNTLSRILNNTEHFQNNNNNNNNNNGQQSNNNGQMMILLIIVVLWLCLVLLVGKHLWNECLCKVVTVCKPMDSVFSLLGVIVLLDILKPNM